ncbi:hypothetical protein RF11_04854 [Thelohanellus kitauei]|uniref:Uncharacterized protein n=1 Tax=Thelohanellus kitauei TaxID=669202 RepID=A0A0C2MYJ6_THEKT|nr:hypothetical protein RF11_04854 [Thelohanellus kitauei]
MLNPIRIFVSSLLIRMCLTLGHGRFSTSKEGDAEFMLKLMSCLLERDASLCTVVPLDDMLSYCVRSSVDPNAKVQVDPQALTELRDEFVKERQRKEVTSLHDAIVLSILDEISAHSSLVALYPDAWQKIFMSVAKKSDLTYPQHYTVFCHASHILSQGSIWLYMINGTFLNNVVFNYDLKLLIDAGEKADKNATEFASHRSLGGKIAILNFLLKRNALERDGLEGPLHTFLSRILIHDLPHEEPVIQNIRVFIEHAQERIALVASQKTVEKIEDLGLQPLFDPIQKYFNDGEPARAGTHRMHSGHLRSHAYIPIESL